MNLSTFLLLVFIYIILFSLSFLITDTTYKLFYFLLIGLATITILNCYFGIIYYIKLRNEPGIPGPRGPKGDPGPKGKTGKCIIDEKCTFDENDAINLIHKKIANKYDTSIECLNNPNVTNCGSKQEVKRITTKILPIVDTIKKIAIKKDSVMDKQSLESTLNTILFE